MDSLADDVLAEHANFRVIRNKFPYAYWDNQPVADHLMIVPKWHTDTLSGLSAEAAQEYVRLLSAYENEGYNLYARAPGSLMKSVVHQHTHLIRTQPSKIKMMVYVPRPYFSWVLK